MQEIWLSFLTNTVEKNINYENLTRIKRLNSKLVYNYVLKTINILEEINNKKKIEADVYNYVLETLKWSDVAKTGTKKQRLEWEKKNYNLHVHNIGSSQIYSEYNNDEIIKTLIMTHGLVGQYIRGEVNLNVNYPLFLLIKEGKITAKKLSHVLTILNECIIRAVSDELYENINDKVINTIFRIINNDFVETLDIVERLSSLNGKLDNEKKNILIELLKNQKINTRITKVFEQLDLWYFEGALCDFSILEQIKILLIVYNNLSNKSKHLTFERIMKKMYIDYKNQKEINIYRKRIIENYLKEIEINDIIENRITNNSHISFKIDHNGNTIYFDFKFSIQATKLIEFCEVAYISDALYKQVVYMIYDLFGFRRDQYDRFYNEFEYIKTMNESINHKSIIIDYITGQNILDVGPGGGALMDLIIEKNPNYNVFGIDISKNIVNILQNKKKKENKPWHIIEGDALNLENYLDKNSIDTIIYSSIIHELYSYIEYDCRKFNHEVIIKTLKSAYNIIPIGGRIIIRDGIMTEPIDDYRIIEFKNKDDINILNRYCHDFKGREITYTKLEGNKVKMLVNDAMEFLYTYTWGEDSYALEVKEQFGYYTPTEYTKMIMDNFKGAKIIYSNAFLQLGYEENLLTKIKFYDSSGNTIKLPNSTYILVIEKLA